MKKDKRIPQCVLEILLGYLIFCLSLSIHFIKELLRKGISQSPADHFKVHSPVKETGEYVVQTLTKVKFPGMGGRQNMASVLTCSSGRFSKSEFGALVLKRS